MAGVFLIRNNDGGREMVDSGISLYKPERWRASVDPVGRLVYSCEGKWAGIDYEQGAFEQVLRPKYADSVVILDKHVLHEHFFNPPAQGCFSMHLPGSESTKEKAGYGWYNCMVYMSRVLPWNVPLPPKFQTFSGRRGKVALQMKLLKGQIDIDRRVSVESRKVQKAQSGALQAASYVTGMVACCVMMCFAICR
jgi:hypothetical protein